jgi:hydroxyethylthiazole kinase-like uncharacterized protein yjeF
LPPLLTAAQMRAIEQAAIASGQVTGLELMERAGAGVVQAVLGEWPEMALAPQRAVVLCGPGNNGGDGFVVARLLKARGWVADVLLLGDAGRLPPDARAQHDLWRKAGGIGDLTAEALRALARPDLVVDALFGTGLVRPLGRALENLLDDLVARFGDDPPRVVAIDLPSGICADSGRYLEPPPDMADDRLRPTRPVLMADLTVTFHGRKLGHAIGGGWQHMGKVVVADIGLAPPVEPATGVAMAAQVDRGVAKGRAGPDAHKYSHGHALVLAGPASRTGAARLAARGALRIGAGLVTLGAPSDALPECAARLTAIMLRQAGDGADLTALLADRRISAVCLGPGLGLDARAEGLVAAALMAGSDAATGAPAPDVIRGLSPTGTPRPARGPGSGPGRVALVLDADALTILARRADLMAALHPACVLTPHAGEFARLFPDIAARLDAPATRGPAYSKVDATREAAARAGCVVLFKGADTVIADPAGRAAVSAAIHTRAAPWLATAGAGDVLAGFITGLIARGLPPMAAAESAAVLHVECALDFGPGLIAEDLPEQLPAVFRRLSLG